MNPLSRTRARCRSKQVRSFIVLVAICLVPGFAASTQRLAAQDGKTASTFYPGELVARARTNARDHAWAAEIRDSLVDAARPWMAMSDDELWELMFSSTITRAWQVWSNGHCPACKEPVPMYEWAPDALNHPWKLRCPQCGQHFPTNDFAQFYRSGLDEHHEFDPQRADRSLLFNTEHPDPSDPLHRFGVDDGEGYVDGDKRWRFISAYLIFGQWKQAVVSGIRNLAAAYVATGDPAYAHKAGVLLDRVADVYPTFDFGKQGVMYEGPPRSGYVSTWHDACVEVHDLALAYDAVFEALVHDQELTKFLAAKAATHKLPNPKATFADVQRNIEERIFRDTLNNRPKIESNYPATDVAVTTLSAVLDWPRNRAEVMEALDAIIRKATAVDGVTGEKGIAGYSVIGPNDVAQLLGRYARSDPNFIREAVRRHPRLHAMYRFHLDTWCLGLYYPRSGDTGSYATKNPVYVGVPFSKNAGIRPSSYTFLWELYQATGDVDFVRVLYRANRSSATGLPYDLFVADPAALQAKVTAIIEEHGPEIKLPSVNKSEWGLAILRSGEGDHARAAWLDYDSGGIHGHADAMTMGLFAKGLDLLPDFGYPPVQFGGWYAPRAVWYTQSAAHNTVVVDGKNSRPGSGTATLWFDGSQFRAVRAKAPKLVEKKQFERTLALVDLSERDSYLVDVFRVVGGREHTRFLHGYFGQAEARDLSLTPVTMPRYGEVMRNFRRDAQPSEGWSVTWKIDDHLDYRPPLSNIHLRHLDYTRGAEVELAESWVAVGQHGGTADAWIPSVLTRRQSEQSPLASTFVSVLQPGDDGTPPVGARRLELRDAEGRPSGEDDVALEIQLADGRRHLFISRNIERENRSDSALVIPSEPEVRFDGELGLVALDATGRPTRLVICRGRSLHVGEVVLQTKDTEASLEVELQGDRAEVVAGPAAALERIEIAGRRVDPQE